MVIALLLLSLAMIVGGLAAAFFGWDIILNERGWTMVIAGSICASAGAVLLGLTAALGRLGRIRSELSSLRDEMVRLGAPVPPPPVMDPVAAVSSGLLARGGAGKRPEAERSGDDEIERTLPAFLQPAGGPESATSAAQATKTDGPVPTRAGYGLDAEPDADEPTRVDLPPNLFGEPRGTEDVAREERPGEAARVDVFDAPGRMAEPARPTLVVPEPAAAPEEPEPAPAPQPPPAIIGTYTSGDNRYVMFSDGSIEATTPDGVFRFDSLEELKEFIASGGEDRPPGP